MVWVIRYTILNQPPLEYFSKFDLDGDFKDLKNFQDEAAQGLSLALNFQESNMRGRGTESFIKISAATYFSFLHKSNDAIFNHYPAPSLNIFSLF